MNDLGPFADHGTFAKIQAGLELERLKRKVRRKRHKRQLVNVEVSSECKNQLDEIKAHVRGTESWAPLGAGSVKLVKRIH